MTVNVYDRVKVGVASAPGTGAVSLGSAVAGYQTFAAAAVPNGAIISYVIEDGASWEIGHGTYSTTGPTLTRTTVVASSNSGAAISASVNAVVYSALLAEDLAGLGGGGTQINPPLSANFTVTFDDGTHIAATDSATAGLLLTTTLNATAGYLRALTKAVAPAGAWSMTAQIRSTMHPDNYNGSGLAIVRGSSFVVGLIYNNVGEVHVTQWNQSGGFNQDFYKTAVTVQYEWMQIACDTSGNLTFQISRDGKIWTTLYVSTVSNVLNGAPDHIGFTVFVDVSNGRTVGMSVPNYNDTGV